MHISLHVIFEMIVIRIRIINVSFVYAYCDSYVKILIYDDIRAVSLSCQECGAEIDHKSLLRAIKICHPQDNLHNYEHINIKIRVHNMPALLKLWLLLIFYHISETIFVNLHCQDSLLQMCLASFKMCLASYCDMILIKYLYCACKVLALSDWLAS